MLMIRAETLATIIARKTTFIDLIGTEFLFIHLLKYLQTLMKAAVIYL